MLPQRLVEGYVLQVIICVCSKHIRSNKHIYAQLVKGTLTGLPL
ncbi:unnamed protein product [Ixodes persulcatus]